VDDLTLEDLVDLELVDENSLVLKIGLIVYRLFYAKGDILTPVSSGYVDILSKKYSVEPSRIHVVRGGVDLSIFKPNFLKQEARKNFVVLYSGAFSIAYDFNLIFQAAKIIEELDDDVEFVVQGTGELLSQIQDSIKKFNVKNVKIVNKVLSRTEVAELLGEADALILPLAPFYKLGKPYRGMSSKLYEYQAVGKPIISCSRGLPSDYIKETNSGLIVNPGDFQALANSILELKRNPTLSKMFGENGRKYVEKEGSVDGVGLKILSLFKELEETSLNQETRLLRNLK
jgi:glycosyltransferase involved in cell wall biosynthesis